MAQLAHEYNAVNLAQGAPDFDCSPHLIDAVYRKMQAGHNQYAPMQGILRLREVIAEKIEKIHGHYYSPDTEITITAGATQAISSIISAIIRPGDEAIIIEPAYDAYAPLVKIMGGIVKAVELSPPNYRIDWFVLRRLINSQTKLIIVNTPHNPTGSLLGDADMQELIRAIKGTDIMVISDEVYEHIIYDGYTHNSVARYPELREKSFIVASFGKLVHATGWKVGYCVAPVRMMEEFRKIHQYQMFSVNTPVQHALTDFMQEEESYMKIGRFYQEKRDMFFSMMQKTRFKLLPCKGSYFVLAQYDEISTESDVLFAQRLAKEYGVTGIPVSSFYSQGVDHHVLRFCFAKNDDTLSKATKLLSKL